MVIVRALFNFIFLVILVFIFSCDNVEPFKASDNNNTSVSFTLAMNSALPPDKVFINVSVEDKYYQDREVPFNTSEGVIFKNIPIGSACINIDAVWGDIKILDGHAQKKLKGGFNSIRIPLNNVLIASHINQGQEDAFIVDELNKSSFWVDLNDKSIAIIKQETYPTEIIARAAWGSRGYYFIFEVADEEFVIGPADNKNDADEWINDAFIMYISTNMSTNVPEFGQIENRSFYRIQYMMGAEIPNNGEVNVVKFNNGIEVENLGDIIANFNYIISRIIIVDDRRVLEVFVPGHRIQINGDPSERLALVLRYIDKNAQQLPKIIDWKDINTNPKNNIACWGNLELQ